MDEKQSQISQFFKRLLGHKPAKQSNTPPAAQTPSEGASSSRDNVPSKAADAAASRNKGLALGKLGRYEEAIIAFDEAIRLDPTDALAHIGKEIALLMQNKVVSSASKNVVVRTRDDGELTVWKVGDVIASKYGVMFEVVGQLGKGGMGLVYKVHSRHYNSDLAVKCPRPEIFAKTGGKENFVREAETWVNLGDHPHIVSCYFVETLGGIPHIFAEYIGGGSLADWIRWRLLYKDGPEQALQRMLDAAIQSAWGLHYAHEQGLVHQDVKPANILMTTSGIAKVTDFGLAKAQAMAGVEQMPRTGQSILVSWGGMTPAYCSPEQAAGRPLSRKTDIWSWAVSVLEMFVGAVTWMVGDEAHKVLSSYQR